MAPEAGVRALLHECFMAWQVPAESLVTEVHKMIQSAMIDRVTAASEQVKDPFLGQDAQRACISYLEARRDATSGLIQSTLAAEAGFPSTPAFLELRSRLMQQPALEKATREPEKIETEPAEAAANQIRAEPNVGSETEPVSAPARPKPLNSYYVGWLEKKSRRGRWQRRWVVLNNALRQVWYSHKPDAMETKGLVDLSKAQALPGEQIFGDGPSTLSGFVRLFGDTV